MSGPRRSEEDEDLRVVFSRLAAFCKPILDRLKPIVASILEKWRTRKSFRVGAIVTAGFVALIYIFWQLTFPHLLFTLQGDAKQYQLEHGRWPNRPTDILETARRNDPSFDFHAHGEDWSFHANADGTCRISVTDHSTVVPITHSCDIGPYSLKHELARSIAYAESVVWPATLADIYRGVDIDGRSPRSCISRLVATGLLSGSVEQLEDGKLRVNVIDRRRSAVGDHLQFTVPSEFDEPN